MDATDTLSLDPKGQFSEEIGEWADGETYTVTLKIKQTAPGEFDVLSLTEADEAAEPDESAPKSKTGNPAMDNMMK